MTRTYRSDMIESAPPNMKILLTGGAGFIGSHTYVVLLESGFIPIIVDDFSNSHVAVIERLQTITQAPVLFERGDVTDTQWLISVLRRHSVDAVMHFAAFKAVGDSVSQPLKYYRNNIDSTLAVLEAMQAVGCKTLLYSSSATVYGDPDRVPITEDMPRSHKNPYGHTKLIIEDMLAAVVASEPSLRVAVLRYFNPVGAHESGLIGEDPNGVPSNLMPTLTQVAVGKLPLLEVYGGDYDTPDGTGVRDYVHVMDLARGHAAALAVVAKSVTGFTVNLGTGRGCSVLELIHAFEAASGTTIRYNVVSRRAGDVAECFADVAAAKSLLSWTARHSIADMCRDAWRWQSLNPDGFCEVPSA